MLRIRFLVTCLRYRQKTQIMISVLSLSRLKEKKNNSSGSPFSLISKMRKCEHCSLISHLTDQNWTINRTTPLLQGRPYRTGPLFLAPSSFCGPEQMIVILTSEVEKKVYSNELWVENFLGISSDVSLG